MMFVSWSDQNNILIYRTFEDFKRFHKELKKKFPIESGSVRSSDRTIPRFRDANVKHRKSGKLKRCLEILKLLETYCQELLKTDAKISQGEDVIQFFKAQTQDLDPSFPENSVVIMPSEIGAKSQGQQQLSSITHPQASQSYRCIETFETKDTKNKPFKATEKEILEVLIKDMTGWWLVENADKQIAWFPASYLEEIDIHRDIQNALSSNEEVPAWSSDSSDQLHLPEHTGHGDPRAEEMLGPREGGTFSRRYNGCTGYMPSMCLQPYKNPHHKLQSIIHSGLNVSTPNLCSSIAPQPQGEALGRRRVQAHSALHQTEEDVSSLRSRSRSLPGASSTSDLESDSSSLSSGSSGERDGRLSWKPDLSRSLPEVEQARSSLLGRASATHSSKAPHLTPKDRNDSGFVESSAADLSCSLTDPDSATSVPKVPARPSAHEILQRCSTVTKRALQQSSSRPALQALLPLPGVH
ncbi:PREDICTED: NADPH oxidase organizer 1 [Merops nubicus]|uniref:NADPH oxidase organizer 1 n=1 Tax=Merops nubicus TaxID=57421 RepID=UPI0004F08103|nr:PREDICTED: NADPH oxidase organizer 1 [Merops nubicus]